MAQRIKTVQESDLRMLGSLARNIQRVLPVTQADIDAAAALGKGWVVTRVFEVSEPLNNLRGGTQLVIRQNSILPGQNVQRVLIVSGPGGQTVVIRGSDYIVLPDAVADSLSYVKAFGGTEQRNIPDNYIERQFIYMMEGSYIQVEDLPISAGYRVEFDFQTTSLVTPVHNYIGGRDVATAGGGFRLSKLSTANDNRVVLYGFEEGTEYYDPTTQFQANTRYKYTYNNGVCTLESGGSVVSTQTFTINDTASTPWGINIYYSNGTWTKGGSTSDEGIYVYSLKVWNDQDELVMDLVPAVQKGTVPVVGFYDAATGGFRTPTDGTFAAGGEAVPTPDAPMDIVSNNGVLKARHQSGLPLGYTLLEYIESTGTQYIDTGYFLTDIPTETVTIDFMRTGTGAGSILYGARNAYKNNGYGIQFTDSGRTYMQYGEIDSGIGTATLGALDTRYTITQTGPTYSFLDASYTSTGATPTQSYPLYLFTMDNGGAPSSLTPMRVYSFVIKDSNNVEKLHLVPVKNSSNVIGMYDLVSGQFFTNDGTGTFTAGTPVSDPIEIYTDGTVETINVHGKNLFNKNSTFSVGQYVNGVWTEGDNRLTTDYIMISPNTNYTVSVDLTDALNLGLVNYNYFDKDKTWLGNRSTNGDSSFGDQKTKTFNISNADTRYVKITIRKIDNTDISALTPAQAKIQLEQGSTATAYEPYYDGGTATAEMLLKVGDYQDVQSIIDGVVARNIGVKVFDGTETGWVRGTNSIYIDGLINDAIGYSTNNPAIICSHFRGFPQSITVSNMPDLSAKLGASSQPSRMYFIYDAITTSAQFQQFLADQYNAGTPVIVVYPLATATTESVAGQTLQVQEGDNVLEITQASLSNLELEAQYQAAVSLTIQEVQDANLDPNVEVTIN